MSDDFKRDLMSLFSIPRDRAFAEDVYRALSNMQWRNKNNPENIYACSWRYAGGLVAEYMNQGENYIDYYCSGSEGYVSEEVEKCLNDLGWEKFPYEEEEDPFEEEEE